MADCLIYAQVRPEFPRVDFETEEMDVKKIKSSIWEILKTRDLESLRVALKLLKAVLLQ